MKNGFKVFWLILVEEAEDGFEVANDVLEGESNPRPKIYGYL